MFVFFVAMLSSAAAAKYCCAPAQWEGDVAYVMAIISKEGASYREGTTTMSTDHVNGIVAFNQTMMVNGNRVYQHIVNDIKNNVMHSMNAEGCERGTASQVFSRCIPAQTMDTLTYTNIQAGIVNRDVFNVPAVCPPISF